MKRGDVVYGVWCPGGVHVDFFRQDIACIIVSPEGGAGCPEGIPPPGGSKSDDMRDVMPNDTPLPKQHGSLPLCHQIPSKLRVPSAKMGLIISYT